MEKSEKKTVGKTPECSTAGAKSQNCAGRFFELNGNC